MNRIRTLYKKRWRSWRTLFLLHVNTIGRPGRHPDLRLLDSRIMLSMFLLFKNHLAYGSLLQSQTKINKYNYCVKICNQVFVFIVIKESCNWQYTHGYQVG